MTVSEKVLSQQTVSTGSKKTNTINTTMNMGNILLVVAALIVFLGIESASAQMWKLSLYGANTWTSIASSSDGARLVAVAGSGQILTSTNGGNGLLNTAWITNNAPAAAWTGVASSADGSRLVAVNSNDGGIYTNSGINWSASFNLSFALWQSVAASDNGSNLIAAGPHIISEVIYYSTNAGASWAAAVTPGNYNLQSIAFAGNGPNVFAAGAGGVLIASTNDGASWFTLNNAPLMDHIACSTNGLMLAGFYSSGNGPIYTSINGGASWITNRVGQSAPWTALATSADGTKLVAASAGLGIFHSFDAGAHWQMGDAGVAGWSSVASSADGTALAAVAPDSGFISIGRTPLPTLNLSLTGTNVSVFWTTNAAGYGLFLVDKPDLTTNSFWQFTPLPVITNTLYRATMPATNRQIFFRLENAI